MLGKWSVFFGASAHPLRTPQNGLNPPLSVGHRSLFPPGSQSVREVPAGLQIARIDLNRPLEMGYSLVELPPPGKNDTEAVVGIRVIRLDFQGLTVMGDGVINLFAAGQDVGKVVVGFGIVRRDV